MILHNIKVAVRNLMKYKLQTAMSMLSIAIGIVTLSFTHSIVRYYQLSPITDEHYYQWAYLMYVKSSDNERGENISPEMMKALKADGGLKNADRIVFPNNLTLGLPVEFHLTDSTVRKGFVDGRILDPGYANFAGLRSALTGNKIKNLKAGEAIVSEDFARKVFQDKNPIGAVSALTTNRQPIPATIVDVYKSLPLNFREMDNDALYFCITDSVEELGSTTYFESSLAYVVLKNGSGKEQLQKEIENRLKPWDVEVRLKKTADFREDAFIITVRIISYLIGCLILLAAIIGFLRMQIQLVWLRNREISLRLINGASRKNLFSLFMTEIGITLTLAVSIAVLLGYLLQDFLYGTLGYFLEEKNVVIGNLWLYSLATGGILFAICAAIVCLILHRMTKSRKGLAVYLRGKRNHLFRNVMLGLQIAICLVFVCSSFILIDVGNKIRNAYFIPRNDEFLKECLYLRCGTCIQKHQLYEEIKRLPDLDYMVTNHHGYYPIRELTDNSQAQEELKYRTHIMTYSTDDTTLLKVLDVDVDWINNGVDRNECLLIRKDLYDRMNALGILDMNALTIDGVNRKGLTLPIAGTFNRFPYETDKDMVIAISQKIEGGFDSWMLIPKPMRSKSLARNVDLAIEKIAPEEINKMIFNYRDMINPLPEAFGIFVAGGWILGCVSILICMMGVFSTITLDTRARKKEVAIRKVNGAKSGDIYRMFGKVYAWLIFLSLLIAIPVGVISSNAAIRTLSEIDPAAAETYSPYWLILFGCVIVILLIFIIVGIQINRVMQEDPAKLVSKE